MAAKKKKKRLKKTKAEGTLGIDGPTFDSEERMHFSQNDLIKYDLAEHKLANTNQIIQLKAQAAQEATHQYQQLIQQIKVATSELKKEQEKYTEQLNDIRNKIEVVYGIDMNECTFDDATGLIHKGSSYVLRGQRKK